MSLNTVNDINPANRFDRHKFSVRHGYDQLISKNELKQEAIKWIVTFKNKGVLSQNKNVINWIKMFFNITDEDLM